MDAARVVHIAAGSVALVSGYLALFAAKGATVHRRAGLVFVAAMLVMTISGGGITLLEGVAVRTNLPAALLTACLVVSALATVRPPPRRARELHLAVMCVTLAVGLSSLTLGIRVVATGVRPDGMPPFPYFLFGIVGTLAAVGDLRVLRSGPLTGSRRLGRHLWRMCFALFIAALSFFIGQADELPPALRIFPLLALPVLTVLVAMGYWSWRVRRRGRRAAPAAAAVKRAAVLALVLSPAEGSAQGDSARFTQGTIEIGWRPIRP